MEAFQKILNDSGLIKNLFENENDQKEFLNHNPDIERNFNIVFPIYEGTYPTDDIILIESIKALSFLECKEKLEKLLVILHYSINADILKQSLNEDLYKQYENIKLESNSDVTYIKYGMLDYLKFLKSMNNISLRQFHFTFACHFEKFEIMKWIYSLKIIKEEFNHIFNTVYDYTFWKTCTETGNLEIAQWLYGIRNDINLNLEINEENIFTLACNNGFLKIVEWLSTFEVIDIHIYYDLPFRIACEYGHLNIAQFLWNKGRVDLHALDDDNQAFAIACRNGHFELSKWLYNLSIKINSRIDIHQDQDQIFKYTCTNGQLKVAIWLYSLGGIDIHIEDDFIFKNSPSNIIIWLKTLS